MADISVDYVPTPKQRLFHETTANEVLYGGAAGGGKTKATVMDALLRCLYYPGSTIYIFRRTFAELEGTVIKEALASYPTALYRYVKSSHTMYLPQGGTIKFCHCAYAGDVYNYQGHEVDVLYFDELTHFTLDMFEYITTRNRTKASSGLTPIVRSTANPGNVGHGWVKARYVDAGPYGEMIPEIITLDNGRSKTVHKQYIPALVTDNPYISDDYLFKLQQKPKALRRALLNGDWDAFEGQVFMEFTDDPAHYADGILTHVIEPFEVPAYWPRYMSFDWGSNRPFSCGWWAIDPDGTAYRYREWYGWDGTPNKGANLTVSEIAAGILEREEEERREGIEVDRICDPSLMFERERGDSLQIKFAQHGIHFRRGDNARMAAKAELHERLRFRENGRPALYVFTSCRQFIRTIPALPYSLTKPEDVDTAAEDHVYDESRYFLMAHKLIPDVTEPKRARGFDPFRRGG